MLCLFSFNSQSVQGVEYSISDLMANIDFIL